MINLNDFGIEWHWLVKEKGMVYTTMEENKMAEEFKEATSGDVVKFEKEGDNLEGTYLGHEESKQYPGSYAVKIRKNDEVKVVFVSAIVIDLIKGNGIVPGTEVKIDFLGKKKTQDGKREYNDYKLLYK